MSNPGEQPEVPNTLIEQAGDIPETVVPDNAKDAPSPSEETPPETAAEAAEPAKEEPKTAKRVPWYQQRIDEITKARREAERKLAEAEARLKLQPHEDAEPKSFDPKDLEPLVNQRAEQIALQREYNRRAESWVQAGQKEFGADKFNEICAEVAAMGAGDSPEFMQIVTDPDILPEGYKVLAALRDNPEKAQRIISLPPVKMAAALAAFGARSPAPPQPVSKAPAPIKPIGGSAKASEPEDAEPIEAWMAKRKAQIAARRAS